MKKKTIVKILFIAILSFIVAILAVNINKKSNYVTFTYQIQDMKYEDNRLYITFYNDETDEQRVNGEQINYVIYNKDVKLDSLLNKIKENDVVTITVEDNYGKYKYTIIYKMVKDSDTLFNIVEDYETLSRNNKIVAISGLSSLIIFLLVLCFYSKKPRENTAEDFIIKAPIWAKYIFIGFTIVSGSLVLAFTFLYMLKMCDINYFIFSVIFLFTLLIGLFGVYAYIREKFVFKDQVFTYLKIFGKARSANVNEIKKVVIKYGNGILCKVIFYNLNNEKILWYRDDGTAFKDGLFMNACENNNILVSVLNSVDHSEFKIVRAKYDIDNFITHIKLLTKYQFFPKIHIKENDKEIILTCYLEYVELMMEGEKIRISIDEIEKHIDFNKKLTISSVIDFTKPLKDQVELIAGKIHIIPNKHDSID